MTTSIMDVRDAELDQVLSLIFRLLSEAEDARASKRASTISDGQTDIRNGYIDFPDSLINNAFLERVRRLVENHTTTDNLLELVDDIVWKYQSCDQASKSIRSEITDRADVLVRVPRFVIVEVLDVLLAFAHDLCRKEVCLTVDYRERPKQMFLFTIKTDPNTAKQSLLFPICTVSLSLRFCAFVLESWVGVEDILLSLTPDSFLAEFGIPDLAPGEPTNVCHRGNSHRR